MTQFEVKCVSGSMSINREDILFTDLFLDSKMEEEYVYECVSLPVASPPQRRQPWQLLWPSPLRHMWAGRWRHCRAAALGSRLGN